MKFSHEYVKLKDRLCTTVRTYTPQKEEYYKGKVGQIVFKNKRLIQVLKVKMSELTKEFLEYDAEGVYKFPEGVEDYLMLFLLEKKARSAVG